MRGTMVSLSFPGGSLLSLVDHAGAHKVHLLARVRCGHVRHCVKKGAVGSQAREAVPRQDLIRGSRGDMDSLKVCPSRIGGVAINADSCLRQDFLVREPNPMALISEIERDVAKGSNQ